MSLTVSNESDIFERFFSGKNIPGSAVHFCPSETLTSSYDYMDFPSGS
ncbi:12905_t:CDS:2 [Rhizophagus irregularis]|nr:12905_t:CDS:2 [Rhizophagus irregularis]